jgi:hypothetical protein
MRLADLSSWYGLLFLISSGLKAKDDAVISVKEDARRVAEKL